MEADRSESKQLHQDSRKHVLAGVLLHVVIAASPVDLALDQISSKWRRKHVSNAIFFIDDLQNGLSVEKPAILRLSTGTWIERCSIQVDPAAIAARFNDSCVEFPQVAVGVIQPVSRHD